MIVCFEMKFVEVKMVIACFVKNLFFESFCGEHCTGTCICTPDYLYVVGQCEIT